MQGTLIGSYSVKKDSSSLGGNVGAAPTKTRCHSWRCMHTRAHKYVQKY